MSFNLLKMIDRRLHRVLDVGCAGGRLGAYMLQSGIAEQVYGLEFDPNYAAEAKHHLTGVFTADAAQWRWDGEPFDCIIYGDSIEHLVNPEAVVSYHRTLLKPTGFVLASIPNVRNLFLIDRLINGRWTYTDWGSLDRTHLHLYTKQEILNFFTRTGFTVKGIEPNLTEAKWHWEQHPTEQPDQQFNEFYDRLLSMINRDPYRVLVELQNRLGSKKITVDEVPEFFAIQFHLRADPVV